MTPLTCDTKEDDVVLISRIAQTRDEVAFETLLQRHQRYAFNLALLITGDRDQAEDAMQQASLKIWRNASRFTNRGPGSGRAWVVRLVANEALGMKRTLQRTMQRDAKQGNPPAESSALPIERKLQHDELVQALRAHLETLPPQDRQLMALHFGAGITQQELARTLSVSPQMVSYRLKRLLELLRCKLGPNAEILPGIGGAQGLANLIDLAIREGGGPGAAHLKPILSLPAKSGGEIPPGLLRATPFNLVCILVLTASAWLVAQSHLSGLRMGSEQPRDADRTAGSMTPEIASASSSKPGHETPPRRLFARWTFELGPAEELKTQEGRWRWVPAQAGRPAGMLAEDDTCVALPLQIPEGTCLEITLAGVVSDTGRNLPKMSGLWSLKTNHTDREVSCWQASFEKTRTGASLSSRNFLTEDSSIATYWESSRLKAVKAYLFNGQVSRHPSALAYFGGVLIQWIEIREIAREEIPERFRDPQQTIAELKLRRLILHCFPQGKQGVASQGPE